MANESNIKDELKVLFKEHDYNQLYYKQDIVTYQINGTTNFYQAIRNVPRFVPITDRSYWNLLTTGEDNFIDDDEPTNNSDEKDIQYIKFKAEQDGTHFIINSTTPYIDDTNDESIGGNTRMIKSESNSNNNNNIIAPPVFEYSINNGKTWLPVEFEALHTQGDDFVNNEFMLDMDKDDEVMLRGTNPNGFNNNVTTFTAVNDDNDILQMTVTGDIQTLVDKDLNNLEIPNISTLFYDDGISLSSDSNLTCTGNKLTYSCFADMFANQEFIETPMSLPNITNDSFADLTNVLSQSISAPFGRMYDNCTSLTKMFDIPNVSAHIDNDSFDEESGVILMSFKNCLKNTIFAISDDGETLNFQHNLTWTDKAKLYNYFQFVGNTNGLSGGGNVSA